MSGEISTVEDAAAFFTKLAQTVPHHRVTVKLEHRAENGDIIEQLMPPLRAVHNATSKRVEIEVEP